jgi:hypothetical protein
MWRDTSDVCSVRNSYGCYDKLIIYVVSVIAVFFTTVY